jgi:hypothetical protein
MTELRKGVLAQKRPKNLDPQVLTIAPDPRSRIQLDVITPQKLLSASEDARVMLCEANEAVCAQCSDPACCLPTNHGCTSTSSRLTSGPWTDTGLTGKGSVLIWAVQLPRKPKGR